MYIGTKTRNIGRLLTAVVVVSVSLGGASLVSAAAGDAAAPADKGWQTSAAAGLTLTAGNSDTLLGTISVDSERKMGRDEALLGGSLTYGESDDEKTTEQLRGYGQYNRLFNERMYGGVRLDLIHDDIADLNYRGTLSPMLGYYVIKETDTSLSFEGGPSFVYEEQGGEDTGYVGVRIADRFEHKFSEKARVWQAAEFIPQVDDLNNYIIIAEIGAEAALTEKASLRVVLQDYFDNEPAPGRKRNDLKLIASLAYTF